MTQEHTAAERFLSRFAKIAPGEGAAVLSSFVLYFCVLGGYFAVRPVRETFGVALGSDRVRDLFVVTWIASIAIVPIYGWLCARFRRQVFLPWIYGFIVLSLAGCGVVISNGAEGHDFIGAFFYVMISVLNLFVVSVMWSFLLELYTSEQTKRLFGIVAAGGTAGALFGPFITGRLVGSIGNSGVLYLGAGMFLVAIACQRVLIGIWDRVGWRGDSAARTEKERPIGGNPFAGFWLVLKSPFLLGIAVYVVLMSGVSTFLYFEQLRQVTAADISEAAQTRLFSNIDFTVQALTFGLQIFATGRLAYRWGIGVLLTAVPILMIAGMSYLVAFNSLAVLIVVIVIRRVGQYAFVRPGREMLFSRVDTESKYKAKNFIDVPVYRGGDALVAQTTGGFGSTGNTAVLVGTGVAAIWAVCGWWLGRRKEHRTDAGPQPQSQPSGS